MDWIIKMISDKVKALSSLKLEEMNNISMDIARELVKEEFNMSDLADIEVHIMDLVRDRMLELGCKFDKEDDFLYLAGLTVETSLYLGINIGRKLNENN
jgi:hypothetical protein